VNPAGTQRYALHDEIARGGMGVIYRATDLTLGREVAVKVLQERYAPDLGAARRFADEARIAAQLQHPGIPPVHDLGTLPDGRPFLAMKLIKGQTLNLLLEQRPDPAAERFRFVAVFEQVCQALAYAHAHHVIHRDLKPANVMVGAFGEVQVMDWGLAKVLSARPADTADPGETTAGTQVVSLRESDGSFTQAGSVLGTPAFMAPEQAAGAVGKVDLRSDVFGLGAILAVILTGRPPFAAGSAETVRVQAAQGQLGECFARLDSCGADPELAALCKRCLAASPGDRPSDAGQVAQRVASYLAEVRERLQAAEIERAAAQARACEERKRRRLSLALAALVLLAVLGGGGGLLWYQQGQAAVERDASLALQEAVLLKDKGEYAEATAALGKAEGLLTRGGPDHLRWRAGAMRADFQMLATLAEVRLRMADEMRSSEYDPLLTTPLFKAAFRDYGIDVGSIPVDAAARQVSARAIRVELVEALEDWAADVTSRIPRNLAPELARLEQVPADTEERKLLHRLAPLRGYLLQVVEAADPDPPPGLRELRNAIAGLDRQALSRLAVSPAVESLPPAVQFRLAIHLYVSGGSSDEMVALLRRAQRQHPTHYWINHELGYQLMRINPPRVEDALRFHSVALALRPRSPGAHHNVGHALQELGRTEEAIAAYRQALALQPNYAYAHNNLANCLTSVGQVEEGILHLRQAIGIDPDYAGAWANLGRALNELHHREEALAALDKAIALNPKLVGAHLLRSNVLADAGRLDEALIACGEAARLEPNTAAHQVALGTLLLQRGRTAEAVATFRTAVRLAPDDAYGHNTLAAALLTQRSYAEALAASDQAIHLQPRLAHAHTNRGLALAGLGRPGEAIASCREAVAINPTFARGHYRLGVVLLRGGQVRPAAAALEEAVRLNPHDGDPYFPLALALLLQGRLTPALESARLALGAYYMGKHYYVMSARCYRAAFEARPALTADPGRSARYNAACAAGLAGCGQGEDVRGLEEKERAAWRWQALDWLRADLTVYQQFAVSAKAEDRGEAVANLAHWQVDTDLTGVREPPSLAKLPAAERSEWEKLWADVRAALGDARKTTPPAGK
jgi:serine/threonine-protein kinase